MAYKAGFKKSYEAMLLCLGSKLSGQNVLSHDCGANGKGGVAEAFVIIHSPSGHLTVKDGRVSN
jgi:hypothetical protein